MERRAEFVVLARQEGANIRELCRRFGVSPPTAYKWLRRAAQGATEGFADRSRRPHASPSRTGAAIEAAVLRVRDAHPAWGGRKIARRLRDLGAAAVPAASTIQAILRRHGRLDDAEGAKHRAFARFERSAPNELWQMDFKGHFAHGAGRCHPLTVLDDHARFSICLAACADERGVTVRERLRAAFERYGLPDCMLADNGAPWGGSSATARYTPLVVWLLRLGVRMIHGRAFHPQTQGKGERFHRTLDAEVIQGRQFRDLADCERAFARWRDIYNLERPHQALDLAVPASRYLPSPRAFPASLPEITYAPDDQVRMVQHGGRVGFHGRTIRLPKAPRGHPVGFRPTDRDGLWEVFFVRQRIAQVNLRDAPQGSATVNHVPEHPSTMSPV